MLKKRLIMLVAAVGILLPSGSICYGETISENFNNVPLKTYSNMMTTEDNTVVVTRDVVLNNDWKANSVMGYDGKAYVGIVNGITGSNGRCLAISSRAVWSEFNVYPGVIYNSSKAKSNQVQRLSFSFMTTNGGGAGVRFMENGSDFYELIFPRESEAQLRVILNKSVGGTRTRLYDAPISTTARRAYNKWYNVSIDISPSGQISWDVKRADGTAIAPVGDLNGSITDPEPFPLGRDVTFEFISGGWRERCAYFEDVVFEYSDDESAALVEKTVFKEDFEGIDRHSKGNNVKLSDGFSSFSAGMGWDGNSKHGIGSTIDGIHAAAAAMDGNFMYLESRCEDLNYTQLPTLVYNGKYPKTGGYTVTVDTKPVSDDRGTGFRFCISDDHLSYYELYFPGVHNNNAGKYIKTILNKAYIDETGTFKREALYSDSGTSEADCILGNVIYTMTVTVSDGKIKYSIKPKNGATGFSAEGTVVDTNNPLKIGKVGVIAGGNGNNYVVFDNFEIKSYDQYTDDMSEPDNVIYQELSYSSSSENILDLGDSYRIRRIDAADNQIVLLSKNGTDFINVGTISGGRLINTISNAKYRYVKLSDTANVKIYTDIDNIQYIPLNSQMKYLARLNGTDGAVCTSSVSDALNINGGIITAAKEYNGDIAVGTADYYRIFRIDRPYNINIVHEQMQVAINVDRSVKISEPIAVVRYFDGLERVISTKIVPATLENGVVKFVADYNAASASVSVIIKDGILSMNSPVSEFIIK